MFLVNSCLDRFTAPRPSQDGDPFSRSYGVSLPSSLTVDNPSALVCSTRSRVSVCGTGAAGLRRLARFLGSLVTGALRLPEGSRYYQVRHSARTSLRGVYLHPSTAFSVRPRPFHSFVGASLSCVSDGIFTVCPSGAPCGLPLRSRLTLIRLALIRKP